MAEQFLGVLETVLTVGGRTSSVWTRTPSGKALHTALARVLRAATTPLVLQPH